MVPSEDFILVKGKPMFNKVGGAPGDKFRERKKVEKQSRLGSQRARGKKILNKLKTVDEDQ